MKENKGMSCVDAGRKGGIETSRAHGHDFYVKIGKKGGHRVKELVKKGLKIGNF